MQDNLPTTYFQSMFFWPFCCVCSKRQLVYYVVRVLRPRVLWSLGHLVFDMTQKMSMSTKEMKKLWNKKRGGTKTFGDQGASSAAAGKLVKTKHKRPKHNLEKVDDTEVQSADRPVTNQMKGN
ncbi:hypothetical protein VNO78_16083 [Psophocarpus tetragonolobus]|uniref:Uncharacterized protein n=1 Tax=Psophocarpus tetragonolobus TaxID=3891 RepID=A0AAN9SH75_PSOTE